MKHRPCKYCRKPGRYDQLLHKTLCEDHKDVYMNIRTLWQAIAEIQMDPRGRL